MLKNTGRKTLKIQKYKVETNHNPEKISPVRELIVDSSKLPKGDIA